MLWRLEQTDTIFIDAFQPAGEPDQAVIDAYLAQRKRPISPQKHVGVKRWYYLLQDNPRIRLTTVGMPLQSWSGAAKILVGTHEIIGEFEGNRECVGRTGLQLQMQPIAWLQGDADQSFATGAELLGEISEQILDQKAIERSQMETQQIYQYRKGRT